MAVKIQEGDKSVTVSRPRARAFNGTGPRAQVGLCPRFGGLSASEQKPTKLFPSKKFALSQEKWQKILNFLGL